MKNKKSEEHRSIVSNLIATKRTITTTPQPIFNATVVKKIGAQCSQCSIVVFDTFQTYAAGATIGGAINLDNSIDEFASGTMFGRTNS